MTRKLFYSLVAACALSTTAAAAFLLTPGQALAQADVVTVDDGDSTQDTDETSSTSDKPDHEERIKEALQPLVDDGTLTTVQVDAVVEALAEARPDGRRGSRAAHATAEIAEILGVTDDELKTALADGKSIADVAAEQGVEVQEVIDAIVTATTERVNAAVEAGRIDQDRADEILDNAEERATEFVNSDRERANGGHGRGGHGRGGHGRGERGRMGGHGHSL